MIPIASLLNGDDDEGKQDGALEMKAEPVDAPPSGRFFWRRQSSSAAYTSSDDMDDDRNSPEDEEDNQSQSQPQYHFQYEFQFEDGETHKFEQIKQERSRSTSEASSLLGALTLQNLRFAPAAPSTAENQEEATTPPLRTYLSMENLTNPVTEDGAAAGNDLATTTTTSSSKPLTPGQAARAARRRSTRSLFPGSTDDDRRAKQRMIVKRCYYKKIGTINELRDEVTQLEQELYALLDDQQAQRHQPNDADTSSNDAAAEETELQAHVNRYVDEVKQKEALCHENQRLRKLADDHYMKIQGRLRVLLDTNRKDMILFTPACSDE